MIAQLSRAPSLTQGTSPLHFGQAQLFPATRRPAAREMATDEPDTVVGEWFAQTYVYTDHEALKSLLVGMNDDAHGIIANW